MQAKKFNHFWKQKYPNTLPLGHELRLQHPNRWFRIHSLPNAKRYAETPEEYEIILTRQNQLLDEILGLGSEMITLFSLFTHDVQNTNYTKTIDCTAFIKAKTYNTHQINPVINEVKTQMEVYIKSERWQSKRNNKILKAIADDEIRVIFISPSKNRILAPYDGGMDILMENEMKQNEFKLKYKRWLSLRNDSL